MSSEPILVTVDGRRRVSLGDLAKFDRYLARVEQDGTIVLVPAVVTPASTAGGIDEFLGDPSTGVRRDRPDDEGNRA